MSLGVPGHWLASFILLGERGIVGVNCLTQEHKAMTQSGLDPIHLESKSSAVHRNHPLSSFICLIYTIQRIYLQQLWLEGKETQEATEPPHILTYC